MFQWHSPLHEIAANTSLQCKFHLVNSIETCFLTQLSLGWVTPSEHVNVPVHCFTNIAGWWNNIDFVDSVEICHFFVHLIYIKLTCSLKCVHSVATEHTATYLFQTLFSVWSLVFIKWHTNISLIFNNVIISLKKGEPLWLNEMSISTLNLSLPCICSEHF